MSDTFKDYIESIDNKRKSAFIKLIEVIDKNIPSGFEKGMQFNFPSYYVPLEKYPKGYRCNNSEPLPFISVGVQKNYISLYHMAIYSKEELLNWFREEYPKHTSMKLNMGKSCIRFSNPDKIPYELIGQLMTKITVDEWINEVEKHTS